MTREELINLAGSEEKAERAIDAILAGIKPNFALMAIKVANIDINNEKPHRYYIGFLRTNGTTGNITTDALSEGEARRNFWESRRLNVKSILCTVDLGETKAFLDNMVFGVRDGFGH